MLNRPAWPGQAPVQTLANEETGNSLSDLPKCPLCDSGYVYADGNLYVCPACAHEWTADGALESAGDVRVVNDACGNVLNDGDPVLLIKDTKVVGSPSVLKVGTRVRNIRLVDGDHDIDCKIDGSGAMRLKSEFVKHGVAGATHGMHVPGRPAVDHAQHLKRDA